MKLANHERRRAIAVDRDAADEDGTTPLDEAREISHAELLRILGDYTP